MVKNPLKNGDKSLEGLGIRADGKSCIDCIRVLIHILCVLIKIDSHNGVPVYRQIMDQVRFQITAGILPAGEPLDSVRNLAAVLGINTMTVSKAYSLLERERVVERRRGQQLVVASRRRTQHEASREDHLRDALAPAFSIIRQLGMGRDEAAKIFEEMLHEEIEEETHEHRR